VKPVRPGSDTGLSLVELGMLLTMLLITVLIMLTVFGHH